VIILEIKVNDYVRTKDGLIFKIIGGNEDNWNLDIDYSSLEYYEENWLELFKYNDNYSFFTNKNIIKSSPRIIDLIEVGDYVNGQLVKHIAYFEGVEEPIKKLIFSDEYHLIPTEVCEENEIKSIVTKEQFEQMEYKID
jgi:hypothetical protein